MLKKLAVVVLLAAVANVLFASTADEGRYDARQNAVHECQDQKAREWRTIAEYHARHRHIDGKCVIK